MKRLLGTLIVLLLVIAMLLSWHLLAPTTSPERPWSASVASPTRLPRHVVLIQPRPTVLPPIHTPTPKPTPGKAAGLPHATSTQRKLQIGYSAQQMHAFLSSSQGSALMGALQASGLPARVPGEHASLAEPPGLAHPHLPAITATPLPRPRLTPQGTSAVTAAAPPAQPTATPIATIAPNIATAAIAIPALGIQAPVFERTIDASGNLPVAPGYATTHYQFSAAPGQRGNTVIYGHDDIEGSIFHYLPSLHPGDVVYLTAGGQRYTYKVTNSLIVPPSDVAVMLPTPTATLTLISCTPYMVDTQRIIVKAALVTSA